MNVHPKHPFSPVTSSSFFVIQVFILTISCKSQSPQTDTKAVGAVETAVMADPDGKVFIYKCAKNATSLGQCTKTDQFLLWRILSSELIDHKGIQRDPVLKNLFAKNPTAALNLISEPMLYTEKTAGRESYTTLTHACVELIQAAQKRSHDPLASYDVDPLAKFEPVRERRPTKPEPAQPTPAKEKIGPHAVCVTSFDITIYDDGISNDDKFVCTAKAVAFIKNAAKKGKSDLHKSCLSTFKEWEKTVKFNNITIPGDLAPDENIDDDRHSISNITADIQHLFKFSEVGENRNYNIYIRGEKIGMLGSFGWDGKFHTQVNIKRDRFHFLYQYNPYVPFRPTCTQEY